MTYTDKNVADIAVVGLAVMGQNLILNMADHGFQVVAYNRTYAKVDDFIAGPAQGKSIIGVSDLQTMVSLLKRPRRIVLMVKAGDVVDQVLQQLIPLLSENDIVIDGGNSFYKDTERRLQQMASHGLRFVGCGISGGEEGARHGPSMMPGGDASTWSDIQTIFQSIAAHTESGESCCDWVGNGGAGHYVKMVHNGIEYGDMQLIAESFQLLRQAAHVADHDLASIFSGWNQGDLSSYLIEITAEILKRKEGEGLLVDQIVDAAGQKGTGKWTGIEALDHGIPLTLITEAVYARALSAMKDDRIQASQVIALREASDISVGGQVIDDIHDALLASKLISYAQGFLLMRQASLAGNWNLDLGKVALLWRGGCIIRSSFLEKIRDAYQKNPDLNHLLLDDWFSRRLESCQPGWRRTIARAVAQGVAVPALSAALAYFDGYRSEVLPANLIQAQRDYFGAHTYERLDRPRGEFHHTDWIGSGGFAQSGSYSA